MVAVSFAVLSALNDIFNNTNGPNWKRPWNMSAPVATWTGITIDGNGDIIHLKLLNNNLTGFIPNSIGALNTLQVLNLGGNHIEGIIPTQICNLYNLLELYLDDNTLSGSIPSCVSQLDYLETLQLSNNRLIGQIPSSQWPTIQIILLENNQLTGAIPDSIVGWYNLLYFGIKGNEALTGRFPVSVCSIQLKYVSIATTICYPSCLSKAIYFANGTTTSSRCQDDEDIAICSLISNTDLTSTVAYRDTTVTLQASSLHPITDNLNFNKTFTTSNANMYEFSFDSFTDISPSKLLWCGDSTCNTIYADLSGSGFTTLPGINGQNRIRIYSASVYFLIQSNLSCSQYVVGGLGCWGFSMNVYAHVSSNGWSCSSPTLKTNLYSENSTFWSSQYLDYTRSYANNICGWTGVTCNSLRVSEIDLSGWGIGGILPTQIGLLDHITLFDLSNNRLSGNLPSELGHMTSLTYLSLASNFFNGSIPQTLGANLSYINQIKLGSNQFSGTLPLRLFREINTTASYVDLSSNNFVGQITSPICTLSTSLQISLSNNKLGCYASCISRMITQGRVIVGSLPLCSPTNAPTPVVIPAAAPNQSITAIIISLCVGLPTFSVITLFFFWRARKNARILATHEKEDEERRKCLEALPIHRAIYDKEPAKNILKTITLFKTSVTEKDYDGFDAYDHCIDIRHADRDENEMREIMISLVRNTLPQNYLIWCKMIQTDKHAPAVQIICDENHAIAEDLAQCKDSEGRPAINLASPKCQLIIKRSLFFFKRYDLVTPLHKPQHKSATCIVLFAIDHDDHERRVALKLVRDRGQFITEMEVREKATFDDTFVISVLHTHDGDASSDYRTACKSKGLSDYLYCLVMPAADKNLSVIISSERIAGKDWAQIKLITLHIAQSLQHMHLKGFIHGDIKPLNIMRIDNRTKLIDLDASAKITEGFSGQKYSSAYTPPELIFRGKGGQYRIKTFAITSTGTPITAGLDYNLILASPAHDVWALGCILFELCSGMKLFSPDDEDNIDEDQMEDLCLFTDDFKRRKTNKISDLTARNLISQLLTRDPHRRPNMSAVLAHPFLSGNKAPRLPGESAEFDVFISYRVASDSNNAVELFTLLSQAGLKVWLDQKCLQPGVSWEEGFTDGLVKSHIFLPLLSRGAINNSDSPRANFASLTNDSPCDNVLLEHRLALEFESRGLVERIYPVMIGDTREDTESNSSCLQFGNYFACGCHPRLIGDVIVQSVETLLEGHLERLCLGSPMLVGMTVQRTLKELTVKQGKILEGDRQTAFQAVVTDVLEMARGLSSKVLK